MRKPSNKSTTRRRSVARRLPWARVEAMEPRRLLTVVYPAMLRHAYGVDNISFNGVAGSVVGDGTGQTIAIVVAYDEPNLVSSTDPNFLNSDLHNFDVMFGLPDPPSFVKIDQNGGTNYPGTNSGWLGEISADVEYAHAMAPGANIVLVEADNSSVPSLFNAAIGTARNYPGVTVVSMSFTLTPEPTNIIARDSALFAKSGITYIASSGDYGSDATGYPAFSSRVIGVGGTALSLADSSGTYSSETVWNDTVNGFATGGAPASYEPKPAYQNNISLGQTTRMVPDVAFDAAGTSAVYNYNSAISSSGHGYLFYGTSLGAPCWAGLVAIANQGRSIAGLSPLDGFTQTLPRLYQLPSGDFHDITSGNNGQFGFDGYSAGVGYDMTTGLGTPIANQLVPDLAGAATLTGRVFQDNHASTSYQTNDPVLVGQTVYLDLNSAGTFVAGDPTAITNASGIYTFTDLAGGLTGTVRVLNPQTNLPAGLFLIPNNDTFTTSYGQTITIDLSYFPTAFSSNNSPVNILLNLDSTSTTEQLYINGNPTATVDAALLSDLTFSFTGNVTSLTVDGTNGSPIPTGGIFLNGSTFGTTLNVIGTQTENDSFVVTTNSIRVSSSPIQFSNVSALNLTPGNGEDVLEVNSGNVTITAPNPGTGIVPRVFSTLSISAGAIARFATATAHADRDIIQATTLAVAGQLDLGGNDLIVHNGDLSAITALLASGYAGGTWAGNGIQSAAAGASTTHLTAIGILTNDLGNGQSLYNATNPFDGIAPLTTDILLKYTYLGDTNLDGKVDGTDYSRIDSGALLHQTPLLNGWFNGDCNYDALINGSDYTLIDNAYNTQGAGM